MIYTYIYKSFFILKGVEAWRNFNFMWLLSSAAINLLCLDITSTTTNLRDPILKMKLTE